MTAHKLSPEVREHFLEKLAAGLTVARAAAISGVGLRTVYDWRKADAEFAAAWKDAYLIGAHALEDEAHRRAVEGTRRPVMHQGRICYRVLDSGELEELWLRDYSDVLLCMLLKARDPERFDDSVRRAKIERQWAKEDGKTDSSLVPLAAVVDLLAKLEAAKAAKADTS